MDVARTLLEHHVARHAGGLVASRQPGGDGDGDDVVGGSEQLRPLADAGARAGRSGGLLDDEAVQLGDVHRSVVDVFAPRDVYLERRDAIDRIGGLGMVFPQIAARVCKYRPAHRSTLPFSAARTSGVLRSPVLHSIHSEPQSCRKLPPERKGFQADDLTGMTAYARIPIRIPTRSPVFNPWKRKTPELFSQFRRLFLVAGAGFEPTTFGL